MRALEITIFLLLIPASMGLVNAFHIFDNSVEMTADDSQYGDMTIDENGLGKFQLNESSTIIDYTMFSLLFVFEYIKWGLKILLAVLWLFPMLTQMFGIPLPLAAVLQVAMWVVWIVAIIQVKRAVSFDGMR